MKYKKAKIKEKNTNIKDFIYWLEKKDRQDWEIERYVEALLDKQKEKILTEIEKLPVGHTPDGKFYWVSLEDIEKLKENIKNQL